MKKLKSLLFAVLLYAPLTAIAQDIEINAENFPDENFRNYLHSQSYGEDGVLTEEEIKKVTLISISQRNISSLKGIEHFSALVGLYCNNNQLTSLDVSYNTALKNLDCTSNLLTSLDVSKNSAMEYLWCSSNQLTSLDVSQNTALIWLICGSNKLISLDVSQNTVLEYLSCSDSQLSVLDLSRNTALTELSCGLNLLQTLDVSQNIGLTHLDCSYNRLLSLNVSKNTALSELSCHNNLIRGESMDALISCLPENAAGKFYVYHDGIEDNVCTKSQIAAAKAKGWTSYYFDDIEWEWIEYEGCDDASGIALPRLETENGDIPVYNLSGQQVSSPVKGGIYIVDGKKVIVK